MSCVKDFKIKVLKNCFTNYLKTGNPRYEFIFHENPSEGRQAIEELFNEGFIKSAECSLSMSYPVLTDKGIKHCKSIF